MRPSCLASGLALAVVAMCLPPASGAEINRVGMQIDDFSLKSQFGKEYALNDFDQDVVVVIFLGTECPLAKLYAPRMARLTERFDDADVAIVGIDSNQQDSIQEIASYAQRHDIEFPILKDPGNAVADQFAAERTPEVFILDKDRVVRYWGRIDDQYGFADGVGYQRPEPTRDDLAEAVEELLAGKEVSVPTTNALGCLIGRIRDVREDSEVTYSNQIARVFQDHCVECHRPGRIGPFEMTSYDEVLGWGEMIREVVNENRMPPWHANPLHGQYSNDMSLSEDEKQLISTWVENGCPQGDVADLPAPKEFFDGWAIGEPDEVIYMRDEPVEVPAEGVVDYYHFVVDPGWTEDKWIMAAEAKPGSLETVHHILVLVDPADFTQEDLDDRERGGDRKRSERRGRDRRNRGEGGVGGGNLIGGYAPGMNPMLNTDGKTAMHIKAGSKLIFQLHYTPNGTPATDLSYVGFKFADPEEVEFVARSTSVMNPFFTIPPGASDYAVTAKTTFEQDTLIANLTPHMHTRGKAFRYEAIYPDGEQEVLLDVPSYDFNWQTTYEFEEPKLMPKGTTLLCTANWDNSADNLSNPDPTQRVNWGDQTWEEMMIGFYVEMYPKDNIPKSPSGGRPEFDPKEFFAALDGNGDEKLTKDELPGPLKERFSLVDVNGDGSVTMQELTMIMKLFSDRD